METLIISGNLKQNLRLLMQLARQLKFKVKKLSTDEIEEMGLALSINEGVKSGFLSENVKCGFLKTLKQ